MVIGEGADAMQNPLEPYALSIKNASAYTGESEWTTKQRIRLGIYEAVKSGRRTLVLFSSVKAYVHNLPRAKLQPLPRERNTEASKKTTAA